MQNRIRQLREEAHMTQVRLSIELEVSQETVSAYEKQKHYPSFVQLVKLSNLFHASIDYIMGLSEIRNPAIQTAERPKSDSRGKMIALTRRLDDRQVELVSAYMQGMIDLTEHNHRR